ncbi:Uncharacterised protein [Mycobacterium tuberculosis]|uniref:Uncharacterized protein n=1 Tax=Mycobacterium tuberculosis TaxID=1773 RepID=A0A654ZCY2_MYCTX|nr:Uncharacterised protein [Mycobacterium tuberculosis]CKY13643.1 Uncharacterised protein [Mycobacterium tuberculosis]CNM13148.1 Uncharacterised protein [Mycobacterium tuberculosis]COW21922.1 Uncharacterised protein [Mycobacterium tuberculosis]COW30932.1 Uncharacterised protein [Mycobacterium tuberculosis]
MYLGDIDNDRIPAGNHPLAELVNGWIDATSRKIDDGPGPLYLQDRRLTQLVTAVVDLLDQSREHVGVPAEPLERPAQCRRRGFVPGGQQREQLVANVLARHDGTVVVSAAQHQRQYVGPIGEVRVGPLGFDELVDDSVVLAPPLGQPAPRAKAAIVAFGFR